MQNVMKFDGIQIKCGISVEEIWNRQTGKIDKIWNKLNGSIEQINEKNKTDCN